MQIVHYVCLCKATRIAWTSSRIVGILPITVADDNKHERNGCTFLPSKRWSIYSYAIQASMLVYMAITYTSRYLCGPTRISHGLEWYVMSFGYFVSDLDSLVTVCVGARHSTRICNLLIALSKMIDSKKNDELHARSKRWFAFFGVTYLVMGASYLWMGIFRFELEYDDGVLCTLLDRPSGVFYRGVAILVTTVQLYLLITFVLIVATKLANLCEIIELTLHNSNNVVLQPSRSNLSLLNYKFFKIHECIDEMNDCFGVQLLVGLFSGLYTIVYYMYRYFTSDESNFGQTHERIHYFLSFLSRTFKLMVLIAFGRLLTNAGNKPMNALRRAKLIASPFEVQQQVQTLMLQWDDVRAKLTAFDVLEVGPWLLAPIAGNIITYLLVALQFKTSINTPSNITSLF